MMQTESGEESMQTVPANGENIPGGGVITKHIAKGFFALKVSLLPHCILSPSPCYRLLRDFQLIKILCCRPTFV